MVTKWPFCFPLILIPLLIISCDLKSVLLNPPDPDSRPKPAIVEYCASGTARNVAVSWVDSQGYTKEANPVLLPWSIRIPNHTSGFLSIEARNNYNEDAAVHVDILVDGSAFRSGSAEGPYAVARAYGVRH